MYFNFMGATEVAPWIADSFPIIRIILAVIIALMSLALIVTVIIQPSGSNGVNPITGQSETFYGKNKSRTLEGFLRKLTVILAISIAVLAVLFFVSLIISGDQVAA
jgi:preprotein translocase subunit SecG